MADSNNNSSKSGFMLRSLSFKKSKKGIQRKRPSSVAASGNLNGKRLSVSNAVVCEAIRPFRAILPCDLSFSVGDRITVTTRTAKQFDWWEGKLKGKTGIFPANFVRVLPENDKF